MDCWHALDMEVQNVFNTFGSPRAAWTTGTITNIGHVDGNNHNHENDWTALLQLAFEN